MSKIEPKFDDEDVRIGLQMLKRYHLQELVQEWGLEHKVDNMGKNDQLLEVLDPSVYDWSVANFNQLIDIIEAYKKESDPLGYYVAGVGNLDGDGGFDLEELKADLDNNSADFNDGREDLLEEGFEELEISNNELQGIYWTQSINYSLNPLRELDESETIYSTAFRLDASNSALYIGANLQSKAIQLINVLRNNGLVVESVGHDPLLPADAKALVGEFIDELKEKSRTNQSDLESYNGEVDKKGKESLKIYSVGIRTVDEMIERVEVDGNADIIDDPDIVSIINGRDGKIIRLEGKFDYDGTPFKFNTSYDPQKELGRISVEKATTPTGEPELVDECFEFLSDLYREYYINF